ncbi:TAXI family TRAP transporter solute-binding subunit [Amycolatopsis pigmentata]|uniref:TAXI family TRAP transporter solute-binding subunit n=1 Tax=Amycolatopsis pigmentata TaxID=450801 RepID=A0ABW5G0K9_9PSEU
MRDARTAGPPVAGRRAVLLAAGLALLGGCATRFDGTRLRITTGSAGAVYNQLGAALSTAWASTLGVKPEVLTSAGSGQNLDRLLAGQADVGITAADAAALRSLGDGGRLRALARMHDDYVQVVVPAGSKVQRLADLRGLRVSVGPADSGVRLLTDRLLQIAGLPRETDIQQRRLAIDDAVDGLARGWIDAFFWSGGLPTEQVASLAHRIPIRLVDLSDVLPAMSRTYDVYEPATLPAATYNLPEPVTTLLLPNYLLVTDRMADPLAQALTEGVFDAQAALAAANPAARSIDVRSGVETVPVPLHAGAMAYYRAAHYVND